jgi:hypothetical protein
VFATSNVRAARGRVWRDFRMRSCMRAHPHAAAALKAEARLLTVAGLILLAIGFPLTMSLALMALAPNGISPVLPAAIGGPPLLLGYLACHFASRRMEKAKLIGPSLAA